MAFVVASIILLGVGMLVACSQNDDKYRVDIFVYATSDEYGGSLSNNTEKLLKDAGYNVQLHDAEWNPDKQMTQIEDALTRGTNLMLVALADYANGTTVATKAKEAGIKVIFFIREPYDSGTNGIPNQNGLTLDNTLFVGARNGVAGNMQGELLVDSLTTEGSPYYIEKELDDEDNEKEITINYILLRGDVGNPAADARSNNVIAKANELLSKSGRKIKLNAIESYDAKWNDANARKFMDDWFADSKNGVQKPSATDNAGKLNLVIGNSDALVTAAIDSLTASKDFNNGNIGKSILTIGMDADIKGKQYIESDRLGATLSLDSNFNAKIIVEMVKNISAGGDEASMKQQLEALSQEDKKEIIVSNHVSGTTINGDRVVEFDYEKYGVK